MKNRKKIIVFVITVAVLAACIFTYIQKDSGDIHATENTAVSEENDRGQDNTMHSDPVSGKTEDSRKEENSQDERNGSEISSKPSESKTESTSSSDKKTGHYETIPAYDETMLVKEAYDEQILVRKGECTSVLVKDAWDEEVWDPGAWYGSDTVDAKVCNGCGEVFYGSISEHMSENPDHGGWHNEQIAQGEPYWHGTKSIIHHDAVYETRCEPDEYTTVHHEAEYKTIHHEEQKVWVEG